MAKCDYCGSSILFGGVRNGQQRFCNQKCVQNSYVFAASQSVSHQEIERQVEELWRGNCPKCNGTGPVDVHKFHQVWSALVLTRWSTGQQLSCRSCATKRQLGALGLSMLCGWWGRSGLILTPVQVIRNIVEMSSGRSSSAPSADLRKLVRVHIGSQVLATNQQRGKNTPPPVPGTPPPVPR